MQSSAALFLSIRAAHVLLATLWVGATFFITYFLFPSLQETGPSGGPMMAALMRRKLPAFQAALGGITVLTGFYLYYRFTSGFDPVVSGSRAAMVFGTGGICGLLALVIGGAVVSRNAKKMSEIGTRIGAAADAERPALAALMAAHRSRASTAARVVIVLQMIAVVLMAIGHYV